ncbi:MAG: TldD/PmbA family protein [Actinomycetota bacterium]
MPSQDLEARLRAALPDDVDHATVRLVEDRSEHLQVRQGVLQPVTSGADIGVMFTVWHRGGSGYAATSDISEAGLAEAVEVARRWAAITAGRGLLSDAPTTHPTGSYASPEDRSWADTTLAERIDLLVEQDARLGIDDRIVDRAAGLSRVDSDSLLLTSGGGRVEQRIRRVLPNLRATAHADGLTQSRTYGALAFSGQGGVEVLDRHGFHEAAPRIAEQVLELLAAPNCPTMTTNLVLAPDQMVLQIHESIGHPLELDRILGDERNFAGTSFVTPDMFGSFRYGSELLDVTFDPTVEGELASYGFDDDGTPAERHHLIRDGILERPLGGAVSQSRAELPGVANSRACSWNRPPIDRMANLNVEPGDTSFDDLIGGIEQGVYMETNVSWSIDDSRNKFQFGCEYGRLIEDGELTGVVRNPNYRGISRTFWRNLTTVGDAASFRVMGVPNCGKGEPNQVVNVGHASPPCHFADVEVFGGES